jgi:hypothetical protein
VGGALVGAREVEVQAPAGGADDREGALEQSGGVEAGQGGEAVSGGPGIDVEDVRAGRSGCDGEVRPGAAEPFSDLVRVGGGVVVASWWPWRVAGILLSGWQGKTGQPRSARYSASASSGVASRPVALTARPLGRPRPVARGRSV